MKPINYLNFIIKYQLRLAIDYDNTVNNPEYEKIINEYFDLIYNRMYVKDDKTFIEESKIENSYNSFEDDKTNSLLENEINSRKQIRISDYSHISKRKIDEIDESYFQTKRSLVYGGILWNEIINEFKLIEEDIKKTPENFTFFEKGSNEYENVVNFINKINAYNKDESVVNYGCFFTLYDFTDLITKLSFKLPTLKPDSTIYQKILNYIYLCVKLYDEEIFENCENKQIVYKFFNNSIVPYGFKIHNYFDTENLHELKMEKFNGSCGHIAALLSIALENGQLLKDFVTIELKKSLNHEINVDDMSIHLLIILSDLLLNKGNLNIYCSNELITYYKPYNEIIFYRSFNEDIIKQLIDKEKNFVVSYEYDPMLIESNKLEYDIEYTKEFIRNLSNIFLKLEKNIENSSELLGHFNKYTYDVDKLIIKHEDKIIDGFNVKSLLPWYYFNFSDDFSLSCFGHTILMKIIDRNNCVYQIIDPNWRSYDEYNLTFKIKRHYCGYENYMYYEFDEESVQNLNIVIKTIDSSKSFEDLINNGIGIEIKPLTLFYGKLNTSLSPVRFPLNQQYNRLNFIEKDNTKFYIGNGICLNHNGNLFLSSSNYSNMFFDEIGIPKFKNLIEKNYIVEFVPEEIEFINKKIKSLNEIKKIKSFGGLFNNYYNLSKYLILILIFVVVIIVIVIVVRLVITKNKIG